jgi:hypothetical protein
LEITAASLPREVTSDEDVALVNAWILKAQTVGRDRREASARTKRSPSCAPARWSTGSSTASRTGLRAGSKGLEDRKVPFLRAKRAREEADRAASAAALRRSQEEARRRVEQERQEAERKRDEAERPLRRAARRHRPGGDRAAGRRLPRGRDAQLSDAAADQAVKDARKVEKAAVREERILAGDHRHVLGKVQEGGGSSSLRTSWKPEVHNAPG